MKLQTSYVRTKKVPLVKRRSMSLKKLADRQTDRQTDRLVGDARKAKHAGNTYVRTYIFPSFSPFNMKLLTTHATVRCIRPWREVDILLGLLLLLH